MPQNHKSMEDIVSEEISAPNSGPKAGRINGCFRRENRNRVRAEISRIIAGRNGAWTDPDTGPNSTA